MNIDLTQPIKPQLLTVSEALADAIESLDTAIESNNEEASIAAIETLNTMGTTLSEILLSLQGDDATFGHFMMGSVCSSLHYWEDAFEHYSIALSSWPDHVGLLNECGVAAYELGRYEKASECFEKSIQVGGETPEILQNYLASLYQSGKKTEAKIQAITAIAKYPQDKELLEIHNQISRDTE